MDLNYCHILGLYTIKQFRQERTISAVYHLLKGKKSSQTIQDAFLFQLSQLFGLYPTMSRENFAQMIKTLHKKNLIVPISEQQYCVTEKGESYLKASLIEKPIPKELNGWKFSELSQIFWERLSQFIQSVSHLSYNRSSYIPITQEYPILQYIKKYILSLSFTKEELAKETYNELKQLLQKMDEKKANIFTFKLSSYNRTGMTNQQLGEKFNEDSYYIEILFFSSLHFILSEIIIRASNYSILFGLIKDVVKQHSLTSSSHVTFRYIQKGLSLDEIAAVRNLKKSTIQDHIIEITLNVPSFDVSRYIQKEDIAIITGKMRELNTSKLKTIREALNNKYSYFQIRLAMVVEGRVHNIKDRFYIKG